MINKVKRKRKNFQKVENITKVKEQGFTYINANSEKIIYIKNKKIYI